MEGKLNPNLSANNATFAKLRHLENRVDEVETSVDNIEQQVTEFENALDEHIEQISEELETESLKADIIDTETVKANEVDTVLLDSENISSTNIVAENLKVDNIEDVSSLEAVTANVSEMIISGAEIIEAEITEANVETTNTETLNVNGSTYLTGTTIIDGDLIFTKDNGLSKLEGNYLDIEASNITIENKNGDTRTALLVKDVDSIVEFEGSLKVHNDVELENLVVNKEAFLSDTTLDNPTLENIADTQRVNTKCLDIDENGKLVRANIGESSNVVSTALLAKDDEENTVVDISANGASFDVPVELNGETTIENAIEVNGRKFYEGEWYDLVTGDQDEFRDFLSTTTLEYPRIMLTAAGLTNYALLLSRPTVKKADIYCPKGKTYQFTFWTGSYDDLKCVFHNMRVKIITDIFREPNFGEYFSGLGFDNCTIEMKMNENIVNSELPTGNIGRLILYNLVNSTFNFTPGFKINNVDNNIKWEIRLDDGCKSSVLDVAKVEGQTIKEVSFGYNAENCVIKAPNVLINEFYIDGGNQINTFIDKDKTLKRIDVSSAAAFYDGEYYDRIIGDQATFKTILSNTTLKNPKILITSQSFNNQNITTLSSSIESVDIYSTKETNTFNVYLSKYATSKFHFHNMNVTIDADVFDGSTDYFQNLKFDNCSVSLNMRNISSDVFSGEEASLKLYNLVNSTFTFTAPNTVNTCKWGYILGEGCENFTLDVNNIGTQDTKTVDFGTAKNCTIKASYLKKEEFNINTDSESMNTFINKDGKLKRIDLSLSSVIYDGEIYDGFVCNKEELFDTVSTATSNRKLLLINVDDILSFYTDIATDPGELNYNVDVYFAGKNQISLYDTTYDTVDANAYFTKLLSHITWHNANASIYVSKQPVTNRDVLSCFRAVDSVFYIGERRKTTDEQDVYIYLTGLKNTTVNISSYSVDNDPVSIGEIDLINCENVKVYAKDIVARYGLVKFKFTNNSFIDMNFIEPSDRTFDPADIQQLGCNSNFFQYEKGGEDIVASAGTLMPIIEE